MKLSQLAALVASLAFATGVAAQQAPAPNSTQDGQDRAAAADLQNPNATAGSADAGMGSEGVSGLTPTHAIVGAVVIGGLIAAASSGGGGGGSSSTSHHSATSHH